MSYEKVGGVLRKTAGVIHSTCCCGAANCCADAGNVWFVVAWQLAAGDGTVEICYCSDDTTCGEVVEIAWALSTDGGSTWGTVTYVEVALPTASGDCDSEPAVTRDSGDGTACDYSHTLNGLTTGFNYLIGADARLKNNTLGCTGAFQVWSGAGVFTPATTDLLVP